MHIEDCFRVLELSPDASLAEAKQAYRELAQIWHPDRFANSPKLIARAQDKMQQINIAYEQIALHLTPRTHAAPTEQPSTPTSSENVIIVGIGGAGVNTINRMKEVGLSGVKYCTMCSDAEVLKISKAECKLQLEYSSLGAGGDPIVGREYALASITQIQEILKNAQFVVIIAGLGGGTGTGVAPVVATVAKDLGIPSIGVVFLPFPFEGDRRHKLATGGLLELAGVTKKVFVIRNEDLLSLDGRRKSLLEAFKIADDVVSQCINAVTGIWSSVQKNAANMDMVPTRFEGSKSCSVSNEYILCRFK